jgi:hypothetical protein
VGEAYAEEKVGLGSERERKRGREIPFIKERWRVKEGLRKK